MKSLTEHLTFNIPAIEELAPFNAAARGHRKNLVQKTRQTPDGRHNQ